MFRRHIDQQRLAATPQADIRVTHGHVRFGGNSRLRLFDRLVCNGKHVFDIVRADQMFVRWPPPESSSIRQFPQG
jgi:hypothetical protein